MPRAGRGGEGKPEATGGSRGKAKGDSGKGGATPEFNEETATAAVRSGEHYHRALMYLAVLYSNRSEPEAEIIAKMQAVMHKVPPNLRDRRWQARSTTFRDKPIGHARSVGRKRKRRQPMISTI